MAYTDIPNVFFTPHHVTVALTPTVALTCIIALNAIQSDRHATSSTVALGRHTL